ncbi:MAG: phosphatase PAP2 family protein [Ignavibacteria bacterium]|nr:phosphatase PAP2 family protein [Ignavibacteria bacterium]
MEFFYNIDVSIFYFINKTIANTFFDKLFVLITTQENWYLTYIFLIYFLWTRHRLKGKAFVLILVLTITVSDQLSSQVIKEIFERIRPCHSLEDVRLLVHCGAGKSFPSSHSVNNFAFATLMSSFFTRYKLHFFIIASLIAISRVYVGVHYPADVLFGAFLGLAIGYVFVLIFKNLTNLEFYKKFESKIES